MALPLVFVIPAAASGIAGAGKIVKSIVDNHEAGRITDDANSRVEEAKNQLERSRHFCADALSELGEEKLFVLGSSITRFVDSFEKIKNLDLVDSLGLDELRRLRIDKESMSELREMQQFAVAVAGGAAAGAVGGVPSRIFRKLIEAASAPPCSSPPPSCSARPSPPASTCPGTSSCPIRAPRCTSASPSPASGPSCRPGRSLRPSSSA